MTKAGSGSEAVESDKASARWYRVEGPLFIEPGGRPEDGLEVVLVSGHSVRIPCAREKEAREGAAHPLASLGANALLDCRWDPKLSVLTGTPALVCRRSPLGRETRETLAETFVRNPPEELRPGRPPQEPVDWRRPAAAAAKGVAGLLGTLFMLIVVMALTLWILGDA